MDEITYRPVGQSLFQDLTLLLLQGLSVVLLGSRDTGKRYVLRQLAARLTQEREPPPFWLELAASPIETEEQLRAAITAACGGTETGSHQSLTHALAQHKGQRRPLLFASNVDSLPHPLARRLLKELQDLVKTEQLVVVLTGESDLTELVHGPDSQFNCAHQFVVQGFTEEEFVSYISRRWESVHLPNATKPAFLTELHRIAGGNIHHARTLLRSWLERQAWVDPAPQNSKTGEGLFAFVQDPSTLCGMEVFYTALREVERSPGTWRRLAELLQSPESAIPCQMLYPEALELIGLAVRRQGQLHLASPMVERFVRRHYDRRRQGDLHAIHGDWVAAFGCYRELPPLATVRPGGGEDRLHLPFIIEAFGNALHARATSEGQREPAEEPAVAVERLFDWFADGCRLLLGFTEVRLLHRPKEWEILRGPVLSRARMSELCATLPSESSAPLGIVHSVGPVRFQTGVESGSSRRPGTADDAPSGGIRLGHAATLTILPSLRRDRRDALLVGDCWSQLPMARERQQLLNRLTEGFASAYHHIISYLGIRRRLQERDRQLALATEIFQALGRDIQNPMSALRKAGHGLLQLGYARVMFSLVNPEGDHVDGVLNCAVPEMEGDLAEATHYRLAEKQDLQQWVVKTGKPYVVPDWRVELLANRELSKASHMRSFAVVPMIDVAAQTIGTIHVERADGQVPSAEEMEDLMTFGKQLAVAVALAERIYCLHQALDEGRKAVALCTPSRQVLVANDAAASLGLTESSINSPASPSPAILHDSLARLISVCLDTADTQVQITKDLGPNFSGQASITCEPVPDWRPDFGRNRLPNGKRRPLAVGVFVREFEHIDRVFRALDAVAREASEVAHLTEAVTAAANELGFPSAQFYRFDSIKGRLLSRSFVGDLVFEDAERFREGGVILDRSDPETAREAFLCFDRMNPVLYHRPHCDSLRSSSGEERTRTRLGIGFTLVENSKRRMSWKNPGSYWLDIPLHLNGRIVGKLTLDFADDPATGQTADELRPDQLEMLRLFAALLPALLEALEDKEKSDSEEILAKVAHNLRQPLVSIRSHVFNWLDYDKLSDEERQRLEFVLNLLKEGDTLIERTRDLVHELRLVPKPVSLMAFVTRILQERIPCHFSPPEGDPNLTANIDELLLGNALKEILQNSEEFCASENLDLRVETAIEAIKVSGAPMARIRIRNNGPGIDPSILGRLFTAGATLRPPKMAPGHGLGLSHTARIVRAHRGEITVGDPPSGAEFIIQLPLCQPSIT
jgi:signal transduction histidine kinase